MNKQLFYEKVQPYVDEKLIREIYSSDDISIFNFGDLNLNKISLNKDYYCLNLIKGTGASSIKIWLSYK